jgi:hypothetical protein
LKALPESRERRERERERRRKRERERDRAKGLAKTNAGKSFSPLLLLLLEIAERKKERTVTLGRVQQTTGYLKVRNSVANRYLVSFYMGIFGHSLRNCTSSSVKTDGRTDISLFYPLLCFRFKLKERKRERKRRRRGMFFGACKRPFLIGWTSS